ncbi:flagellar brake protein [Sporolactobacillus sp. THM19-2]|uniref:flagellar brake protein n=1 Tax=Sporolactobacillus sp. THM19-2 TaxID=2511171 RepID=UPI001020FB50|nr:flagellar brake domain-containing protein [Sporolactobacillus sp. THM19-2]RYL93214.1 pilus assembly protein PilZ [Sporolactobacillus sp. THM19-2]
MLLKIGEHLILEHNEHDGMHEYRCRIADIKKHQLLVDYPVDEKTGVKPVWINGTDWMASYVKDEQVFRFHVRLSGRVWQNIPLLCLNFEGEDHFKRVQRRNFVRVEANLDVAVHSEKHEFPPIITLTSDIGGGGTLIILPEEAEIAEGLRVITWLCLPDGSDGRRYVRIRGQVVRIFYDKETHGKRASICFAPEIEKERQPIIRFCFEKQLESRRKLLEWKTNHPHTWTATDSDH